MRRLLFRNMANAVTVIGIVTASWLNTLVWQESGNYALIFFLVIATAATDFLDGRLARSFKAISREGVVLDRFRDKLFACPLFVFFLVNLWHSTGPLFSFMKAMLLLILLIEFFLVFVGVVGFIKGFDVSSHKAGKVKMWFYFIGIGVWLFLWSLENIYDFTMSPYLYLLVAGFLLGSAISGMLSVRGYLEKYTAPSKPA